jgi:hypothetical protein
MFNNKVKNLDKKVKELEAEILSLRARPEIKACNECGVVKLKADFLYIEKHNHYRKLPFGLPILSREERYLDYCSDCAPKVKQREEAEKIARDNPEMVIACSKKKKRK